MIKKHYKRKNYSEKNALIIKKKIKKGKQRKDNNNLKLMSIILFLDFIILSANIHFLLKKMTKKMIRILLKILIYFQLKK